MNLTTADRKVRAEGIIHLAPEKMPLIAPDKAALDRNGIVAFDHRDKRMRPFNLMRTQVAKRIETGNLKLIGVASATPDAGKSFIALNLAIALSRVAEEPVLLADLDLRRGSLAIELGLTPEVGLSDFLDGSTRDLQSIGWKLEGARVNLLPTVPIINETAELLSRPNFETLIQSLRHGTGKSIVFCDMPPAFANDDAMITMEKLDAYIMVVHSGRTNKKQLLNTMRMFEPTPCIGTVLNKYRGGFIDTSGYGYGYGYGYGGKNAYDAYY